MEGDKRVDELMMPVLTAIKRHVKDNDAVTEIYNRAYEALLISMDVKDLEISKLQSELTASRDNNAKYFLILEEIYDALGMDDHTVSCVPEIYKLQNENECLTEEIYDLREQVRWIPASERLPDEGQAVFVYDELYGCVIVVYENSKWIYDMFSYWMPLPLTPEGE